MSQHAAEAKLTETLTQACSALPHADVTGGAEAVVASLYYVLGAAAGVAQGIWLYVLAPIFSVLSGARNLS